MNESDLNADNTPKKMVRLKGVGGKLLISAEPGENPDDLLSEIQTLFGSDCQKFKNANVILDICGKSDENNPDDRLFYVVGDFLKKIYGVASVEKNDQNRKKKPLPKSEFVEPDHFGSDALIIAGRIRSGQKLSAKNHLIIMGDVNPGGETIAGGDIIVLGNLFGSAVAGQNKVLQDLAGESMSDAVIIALNFKPTRIQIGSLVITEPATEENKAAMWARVAENGIVISEYLADYPFAKYPRLELR